MLERLRTKRTTPVTINAIPLAAMNVAVQAGCSEMCPPARAGNRHVMPSGRRDGLPLTSPEVEASSGYELYRHLGNAPAALGTGSTDTVADWGARRSRHPLRYLANTVCSERLPPSAPRIAALVRNGGVLLTVPMTSAPQILSIRDETEWRAKCFAKGKAARKAQRTRCRVVIGERNGIIGRASPNPMHSNGSQDHVTMANTTPMTARTIATVQSARRKWRSEMLDAVAGFMTTY